MKRTILIAITLLALLPDVAKMCIRDRCMADASITSPTVMPVTKT